MKKLMIAAAIVCAAAFSQAATCYWNPYTASGKLIYQMGSDYGDGFSGEGLIFLASAASQETIWNSIYDGSKKLSDYSSAGTVSIVDGVIANTAGNQFTTMQDSNVTTAFFLVVKDGDNYLFTENFANRSSELPTGNDLKITADYESGDEGTVFGNVEYQGEGGWYSAATPTPEPTSGLLLLLGVAGLALRRRRA